MANVNSVEEHTDIAYVPTISRDKDRELDLYVPPSEKGSGKPPLIVFVHGGAWGGGDKSQHVLLAQKLATSTGYAVAVVNYRLSTPQKPLPHPTHASDVLTALSFLLSWVGPIPSGGTHASRPYDHTRLYLMAHSCGPHILASILLDSSAFYPTLTPPPLAPGHPGLLDAIQAVVCTEGIFDLDLLIDSFPNYKDWFIARSFGPGPLYPEADVSGYSLRQRDGKDQGGHIRWLLINSAGDTLVDAKQSEAMYKHLVSLLSPTVGKSQVVMDVETFTQEHDDVLDTDKIVEVATQFIKEGSLA